MPRRQKMIAASAIAVATMFSMQTGASAVTMPAPINPRSTGLIVDVKKPKCAASTVEDFEGTDMSGVTPKCEAIFDACVNESLACDVRLRKCKEFDKMDRDGSCYKKK